MARRFTQAASVDFDGSQLVGCKITEYDLIVATNEKDGSPVKMHIVRTADNGTITLTGKPVSFNNLPNDVIYIVNGNVVGHAEFTKIINSLPPEKIAKMSIHKPGSPKAKKYSGKVDVKVMEIDLKEIMADKVRSESMYLVDGRTVTEEFFNSMPSSKIKSV